MANAMRLKALWYRDFQHGLSTDEPNGHIRMLASDEDREAALHRPRFSLAAHYRMAPFVSSTSLCGVSSTRHGGGFEADYAIARWISVSFTLDKQQGLMTPRQLAGEKASASGKVSGSTVITGFGVRLVRDRPYHGLSLAIRPGFVTDRAQMRSTINSIGGGYDHPMEFNITHTALTGVLSNDFKINRTLALRSSLGATVVRYRTSIRDHEDIGQLPYISFLSHDVFTNRMTWVW
jgi:hypothetical protein